MTDQRLGKRIREYREKSDLSQEKLAELLDISVCGISNLERGINYPSMETFIHLANIHNVSADALLGDILTASESPKASLLSEMLKNTSPEKRQQILDIVEILLRNDN